MTPTPIAPAPTLIPSSLNTTSHTVDAPPPPPSSPTTALSPGLVNAKKEPLTEEEMAINASGPVHRRRRPSHTVSNYSNTLPTPSFLNQPTSPTNAPSPVAPITEKSDCVYHEDEQAPNLKVERLTPDMRSKLYSSSSSRIQTPIKSSDDDMDYADLLGDDDHEDFDIDIDRKQQQQQQQQQRIVPNEREISTERQEETQNTSEEEEEEEVNIITVERRQRLRRKETAKPSQRMREESEIQDDDDDDDEEEYQLEETDHDSDGNYDESQTSRKKGKAKVTRKKKNSKGKEKTRKSQSSSNNNNNRKSTKRKATAISVGISIPAVASSSSAGSDSAQGRAQSESGEDEGGKKKRGRKGGRDEDDFRLVENMRTLDDIHEDPAKIEYLDKPMSEFTKDIDGIVSKTFKEMEIQRQAALKKEEAKKNMSQEELEELRKKEEEEEREAARKKELAEKAKEEERRRREAERNVLTETSNAVQVRIVNGEIVLDTDTLVVERRQATDDYDGEPREIVEENSMSRKVNSQTYGKKKQSSKWDALETELFYECLSQFGTDFEMISQMMPGRTRGQIRTKFNKEERLNPMKITEYLIKKRKPLDIEKFKEMAGIELEAVPEDFHEMQLA
ncbi:uncharacterized protein BX663DRAFT_294073 [Cokeromyces recurvatus]|uniref:uncharacterized protein n=1 Tax=Cokeromyces recurvatus TaxID=90255 RepID=UPI0022201DC0|nr:uncharacterized protein BX663DRAFT_294073 [Cokeromyces recurvatus]KAI7905798.1 hypothetical protein BX663DRAFT_294073 [Cokeromyces recurvatus]